MVWLRAFKEEMVLAFESSWSYRTNFISETIIIAVLYISLLYFGSGGSLGAHYGMEGQSKSLLLAGYIMWCFSIMAINTVSDSIKAEAVAGTLERKFMSTVPIYVLLFAKLLVTVVVQAIEIAIIVLLSIFVFHIALPMNLETIVIFIITLMGMYGIGLIFGGIALKEKRIGKVVYIIQIMLLFITDTITQVSDKIVVNKIIPLTLGNDLIRKSISNQDMLLADYLQLVMVSFIWLLVGVLCFKSYEKLVKRDGLLSSY